MDLLGSLTHESYLFKSFPVFSPLGCFSPNVESGSVYILMLLVLYQMYSLQTISSILVCCFAVLWVFFVHKLHSLLHSHYSLFAFSDSTCGLICTKSCTYSVVIPYMSSIITVLALCLCLYPCLLIFACNEKQESYFIYFFLHTLLYQHCSLKRMSFIHCVSWPYSMEKSVNYECVGLFLFSVSCCSCHWVCSRVVLCCFDYYDFVIYFKGRQHNAYSFILGFCFVLYCLVFWLLLGTK